MSDIGSIHKYYRIPVSVVCVVVLIAQAYIVNTYLVKYYTLWWLFWILADTLAIGFMMISLIISALYHNKQKQRNKFVKTSSSAGELPLGYISWLIYSILMAARLAIIFKNIAWRLNESMLFGPNMLKTGLSLSSIVFFCLVVAHADCKPNSERDTYVNSIIWRISIDILDTVALLEVLFLEESHIFLTFNLHHAIIAIGCINMILPTLPLVILSKTNHGKTPLTKGLETLQITGYLFGVNIPMLIVRLILWHVHDQNVSVFLIKNVLSLGMASKSIYDHCIDFTTDVTDSNVNEEGEEQIEMTPQTSRTPEQRPQIGPSQSIFV